FRVQLYIVSGLVAFNCVPFQPEHKTLVFVETKRKADDLTYRVRKDGWPALCIHGSKSQTERDWVMKGRSSFRLCPSYYYLCVSEFREGRVPILLATDVASRGLGAFTTHICLIFP